MESGIPFELITPSGTIIFNRYEDPDLFQLTSVTGVVPIVRRNVKDRPHLVGQRIGRGIAGGMMPVVEGRIVAAPSTASMMRVNLMTCLYSILNTAGTLRWRPSYAPNEWRRVPVLLNETPDDPSNGLIKTFQFQLIAERPFIYGEEEASGYSSYLSASGGGGIMFPLMMPFGFTGGTATGAGIFTNLGQLDTYPVIRIHGPITNPIVRNNTTGKSIVTSGGLAITTGQYIDIDTYEETIVLNGNQYLPLDRYIDAVQTTYFPLASGENNLQLSGSSPDGATTRLEVTWENSYAG